MRATAPSLPALRGLLAALLCAAVVTLPATGAQAQSPESVGRLSSDVEQLRQQVAAAADQLTEATADYEQAAARHQVLTQQQWAAEEALELARARGQQTRGRLDSVARAAYIGQVPPEVTALLTGDLRTLGDLARVRRTLGRVGASGRIVISDAAAQEQTTGQLLEERDRLRREALAQKQALDSRLASLRVDSAALAAQLQSTAEQLRGARDTERRRVEQAAAARQSAERAAAAAARPGVGLVADDGTGRCLQNRRAAVNGFLGPDDLCTLAADPAQRLRTDAARAFDALNLLRTSQGGAPLCITDSYRSYPEQVDVFARKPGLAAVPGRSNHGWGMALDLGCGAQTFGTDVDQWLQVNATALGWDRPAWADPAGGKPEPWHYEFVG